MTTLLQLAPGEGEHAEPACPHFGPCGGCQLQHLTYAAQLRRKADALGELLARSGCELPEVRVHASPPLGYRNRIRLTLAEVEGELRAGYLRGDDAAAFLPISECPIAAPLLWRAAVVFLALAQDAAWLRVPQCMADQLELFTTGDETRLNMTLYVRTGARVLPRRSGEAFAALCEAMRTQVPELSGAGVALLPVASAQRSRRSEMARPAMAWGLPGLSYAVELAGADEAAALRYWVPRTAFFQGNRFLVPELVSNVLAAAARCAQTRLAWDLYAGAGLFARPLARMFAEVEAVEIAEAAFAALGQMKLANVRARLATTVDFLRGAVLQRERPDVVLLDPPRTGAGAEVCALLGRVAAPRIIYVSCAPAHLAEDLRTLGRAGYAVESLEMFDLFPQTTHVETVAMLRL